MTRIGQSHVREFVAIHTMVCDLCKVQYSPGARPKVTIESEDGHCDECGRTVTVIDVCDVCFRTKVKPAIEALGGVFRTLDASDNNAHTNYQKVMPHD